ncbi:nitroreductase family deazaflavin-dependent oxidoreductase [Mycobacterium tuberculosis]|uniref:nitroreductase family deazaflavin-dependent oxidoreductase n=1 Tax=Mycobacterium tuberculosis TaxID=1773 RepID=UPI002954FA1A|nr:nitroreductase family deazaflavin-dependent oxidoreductase [Mycobacterium tuberculosis]WOP65514.1 nitroreductase family deazaflavin-dependent oxidoreductase [Mycobacterium tuberculosis]
MQLPQWLARFNRYVTNPIQRLWAGWLPAFAILEHVGRRSGKPYRTPLNVFSADVDGRAGVAILLTYGPNRDWLLGVANPRRLTKAEAAPYVSSRWRPVFARLPFDEAVLLTKAD